jgi:peptidyl-prolyl cis-trans isomerase C
MSLRDVDGPRDAPPSRHTLKGVLRDPLVHFMAIGSLLLGAYSLLDRGPTEEPSSKEIVLTVDSMAQLLMIFESQWKRQPTQDEFNAMIENRIREDVLYREALALGLDKDDTIVKRRMAQKMQFLAEDVAAQQEPTGDQLKAWFAEQADLFTVPARISFRHLYFSADKRGDSAKDDAAKALGRLAGAPQNATFTGSLGDPSMFRDYYADRAPQAIAGEFGSDFARAVAKLEPGSWQGPVKSGYGWHLVFVDSAVAGRVPAFEEVEAEVKTAWLGKQKADAWRNAYAKMRAKYTVRLPVPAESEKAAPSEEPGRAARDPP